TSDADASCAPRFVNMDRYPHESVDYIWPSHVLEHVASLERTIREVHRICALAVCSRSGCRTASSPSSIRSTYAHSTEPRLTCSPRWTWATSLRRGSASTRGSCGDCRWSGTCDATCRGSSDTSTAGDRPPGGGSSSGEGVRSMLR